MSSTSQPSCFFTLSLKTITGESSRTNLFIFKTHSFKPFKLSASTTNSDSDSDSSLPFTQDKNSSPFSKSLNIETENSSSISKDVGGGKKEMPLALKLAMEKAQKYKKNKGDAGTEGSSKVVEEKKQGLEKKIPKIPRDGIIDRKVSSIDFVGLGFSDKKQSRGLPAGLVPMENNFSEEVLSKVEVILGDTSKFGSATPKELKKEDDPDLYKPKVSTWGVFPRPNNISKTFGGGRTIRPGDVLETAEDKTAKDVHTKQLIAAYKKKMGMNIDANLKAECEKALKDGDSLMDIGKLKEALPFYEKVMKELAFQNELHGLAALQWSICQDSLSRQKEARVMYEKLQTHPNVTVRRKAQQFMFGFQAMEILKVKSSSLSVNTTDYGNYFEAFVQDKTNNLSRVGEDEENVYQQLLPYILFLACPIVFVLYLAVRKGI
ncbi:hypothetical protein IFM89_017710 [Coptis chinensis]|uniref:Uncharacterized protein n=1 Tax=Coptis chinensis TaxID=261450 RepID=A0A835HFB0_9MAGN|nr:hypothetical protein IFM89_017710 [Coptis chinensis]